MYEKQCERAQDNGFYFFKYCMENLPPEERKRIFFVIDPHSTDYERVKPYSSNVLKFMSYRQFLYCIAAEMLVGSETKIHLSPVRSRPGYTKHKLAKTMTFFLQHGVMAFKRTDKRMGATGWHPVDYFLVSSEREQDVITGSSGLGSTYSGQRALKIQYLARPSSLRYSSELRRTIWARERRGSDWNCSSLLSRKIHHSS